MGYRFSSAISSIMGEGGNFAILDDPHNVERAESDIVRDETVRKINLALPTRIRSITGALVVIMQRIHERDYAASMLSQPDIVHLCLPMRYEPDHPHVSKPVTLPSGRVLGGDPRTKADELLFPHLFPESRVTALETVMGAYGAAGQMQQRPSPRAGGIFKREWLQRRVKPAELPPARVRVRGWDLAASVEETASWTAGVLLSHYDGHFYVEDVVRLKGLPGDVQNLLQSTAKRDGLSTYQDLPQDPGQSGKSQIHSLTKLLAGYMVRSSPESGSKPSRADAFSGHCQHGHVSLVESHWTNAYVDELVRFPRGDNDQGDGSSRAFNRLVALGGRLEVSSTVGLH